MESCFEKKKGTSITLFDEQIAGKNTLNERVMNIETEKFADSSLKILLLTVHFGIIKRKKVHRIKYSVNIFREPMFIK